MKKVILLILSLYLSSFIFTQSISTELVSSSGDNFTTTAYDVSWSVGEICIESYSSGSVQLTQGFNQSNINFVEDISTLFEKSDIKIWPIPAYNVLNIHKSTSKNYELKYKLMTLTGKCITEINDPSDVFTIDMSDYASGAYILTVYVEGEMKSYKLIKK